MNNDMFDYILDRMNTDEKDIRNLILSDDEYGLEINYDEIVNFLEFNKQASFLPNKITSRVIITEGDVLSILKTIHDLVNYEDDYIIYINDNNIGINTYLIDKANEYFEINDINNHITVDYSKNYNKYIDTSVDIVGSFIFVNTAYLDFNKYNLIIM